MLFNVFFFSKAAPANLCRHNVWHLTATERHALSRFAPDDCVELLVTALTIPSTLNFVLFQHVPAIELESSSSVQANIFYYTRTTSLSKQSESQCRRENVCENDFVWKMFQWIMCALCSVWVQRHCFLFASTAANKYSHTIMHMASYHAPDALTRSLATYHTKLARHTTDCTSSNFHFSRCHGKWTSSSAGNPRWSFAATKKFRSRCSCELPRVLFGLLQR